ncbi:amidohydrolase family protein [Plantactinospora sp. GCM10030261]|uniref:amidohydrolase family protein n=1 Tax=Plantactinospora sp. GCM10030261 TaxID=3273420 RepID=UPI00360F3339
MRDTLLIRDALLLDRDDPVDIHVSDGRIQRIEPATDGNPRDTAGEVLDADGGLVTPAFVEPHLHIDKALTYPRLPPPGAGTLVHRASARTRQVKAHYARDDLIARASQAFTLAIGHGVGTIRAHVDIDPIGGLTALYAMMELRDRYATALDIQLVAFPQQPIARDPRARGLLRAALAEGADVLAGAPDVEHPDDRAAHLEAVLALAGETGVPLDVHCDYSYDPGQRDLERLARRTVELGLVGRVRAGHCCALDAYDDATAEEVIAAVRAAAIHICVCPLGNQLLVGDEIPPRGRGTSRLRTLIARGVEVCAGGDNVHDMWFPFGRLDPAEVAMATVLAAQLRVPEQIRQAFDMVTVGAARYVGAPADGVQVGAVADLVVFSAASLVDVLRNAPGRRTTIKRGRVVGGAESRVWADVRSG